MRQSLALRLGFALSVLASTSGCGAGFFGRIILETEQQRLEDLRAWEARLGEMDCTGLAEEYETLRQQQLVDVDQREDILRDRFDAAECDPPAPLL
ncbi:MAG: hypothetical protein AB8B85_19265 [Paracoccaceae bacterium]